MSPEAQRIAIAEACGWSWSPTDALWRNSLKPGHDLRNTTDLPDYLNDLNAMHEAERLGDVINHHTTWCNRLVEAVGAELKSPAAQMFHVTRATATQRSEAFLRTLGLWTE